MAPGCDGGTNSGLRFNTCSNYGHGGCVYDARLSPMMEYAPDTLTVVTLIGAPQLFLRLVWGFVRMILKELLLTPPVRSLGICFLRAVFLLFGWDLPSFNSCIF